MIPRKTLTTLVTGALAAAIAAALFAGVSNIALASGSPPMVSISSTPLTVIVPSHPQVLIALTNSNSMDSSDGNKDTGNTALINDAPHSAIMTWSGNINLNRSVYGGNITSLEASTSPLKYTVPTGFTAPITAAPAASSTAYTAAVYSHTGNVTTSSGNYWGCAKWTTSPVTTIPGYTSVPRPSGNPPSTALGSWPTALYGTWSTVNTSVWYYNGINGTYEAGDNGFTPNYTPAAMLYRPSQERIASRAAAVPYGLSALSPGAMLTGLTDISELVSGGGNGGGANTRSTGSNPPACGPGSVPYVACNPPPTYYCHLWKWIPLTTSTTSQTYTYYGDNSGSRLNVAKASIASVISTYAATTDFGLMDYKVTGVQGYPTWAYYMSPPGGFTFSSTYAAPTASIQYVMNPCYNAASTVSNDCNSMLSELQIGTPGLTLTQLKGYKFMLVSARGDDPVVNDVFLSNSGTFTGTPVFIEDGTITPSSPYTGFTLSDYNSGNVVMTYSNTKPKIGSSGVMYTYPTNAGYVAYTPQVMYSQRGYLWSGTANASSGNTLVPVSSAGSNPTAAQIAAYVATFTPYLAPENNLPSSDPVGAIPTATYNQYKNAIFANAGQSPIAGMLATALSTYGPAPTGPCPPPRYVILMTDGLPTLDLSGKTWPPLGSAAATGYGVTASFNADGSLNTTNDQALQDTITEIAALKAAGVKTFVVGMGPGVNPVLNPQAAAALTAMAVAGGTGSASPTGYFPGTSPAQVVTDLQNILNIISVSNVSSVSAAANSSTLNIGTTVYQASYSGYSGAYRDWTGDVQAFSVNANTGAVSTTANWSAQCELDAMATGAVCSGTTDSGTGTGSGWSTTRLIATWNPSTGAGAPFEWGNISSAQQTELQPSDTLGQDRLDYLRGDTAEEIHNGGSDGFRDRSHLLGDIVDSAPLYIAAPAGPYITDPTYNSFVSANQNRTPMIYVGANDGMLHAFNANNGQEKFAFIPNGVFANLANLTSTTYNLAHQFFVDGSPSAGDVKFSDGTWHTVLVGGLNDGGQSIYALDVTHPALVTTETGLASDVLWEFTDSTLGLTYSRPVLALTNVTSATNANPNGFLVFFGSGYNNSDGNDYLYAVNPQTGKLVAKINLCAAVSGACLTTIPNGLSSVVVANSGGNISQPVDTVYAGDLQGNLWKINVGNANPSSWTVTLLFQACSATTCSSSNRQPITVTPAVSLAPPFPGVIGTVVYFGTGQYLGVPDQTTTQTQSFYAILDNGSGSTVTKSQLVQQTITDVAAGASTAGGGTTTVATRTVTNNSVNWTSQLGWYMNLPDSGERVVTDPRLYDGEVVFTTYVPAPGALCVGGGAAYLMAVQYSNGGAFPQPQLDINGDGKLDANDQLASGANPVGIGLGSVYASAPDILSTSIPGLPVMKLTTLSSGTVMNVGERGGVAQQRSWIQIQ
jgi:type IV pilus assembly protein PilY1